MKLQQKHRKIMGVVVLSAALTLGVICMDFIAPMSVQVWADTTIAGSWIQASDGRWWYRHADGSYTKSNWEFINGYWYYFDASGWMVTGWCKISEKWYYLSPAGKSPYIEGQRVTGWLNDGGRVIQVIQYLAGQFFTNKIIKNIPLRLFPFGKPDECDIPPAQVNNAVHLADTTHVRISDNSIHHDRIIAFSSLV